MIAYTISFDTVNISVQPGDLCCYLSNFQNLGGFDVNSGQQALIFGEVMSVNRDQNTINVLYDDINNPNPVPSVSGGQYLFCVKNRNANSSEVLGYYLEVDFKNNSKKYAELFSIGSEVVESSK